MGWRTIGFVPALPGWRASYRENGDGIIRAQWRKDAGGKRGVMLNFAPVVGWLIQEEVEQITLDEEDEEVTEKDRKKIAKLMERATMEGDKEFEKPELRTVFKKPEDGFLPNIRVIAGWMSCGNEGEVVPVDSSENGETQCYSVYAPGHGGANGKQLGFDKNDQPIKENDDA